MLTFYRTLASVVALQHFGFLILEMFLWTKPIGRKIFGHSEVFAAESRVLAANQGLYNGFISVGLLWALVMDDFQVEAFFLICIIVAGVFGGLTFNHRIFFVQSLPALVALVTGHLI